MNRRAFLYGSVAVLVAPLVAEGQPTGKVYRMRECPVRGEEKAGMRMVQRWQIVSGASPQAGAGRLAANRT
jgi:hypothetical protein